MTATAQQAEGEHVSPSAKVIEMVEVEPGVFSREAYKREQIAMERMFDCDEEVLD
jgi:hypothetical protein